MEPRAPAASHLHESPKAREVQGVLGAEVQGRLAKFSVDYVNQVQEEHQARFQEALAAAQRTVQAKDEEIKRLTEHLRSTKAPSSTVQPPL